MTVEAFRWYKIKARVWTAEEEQFIRDNLNKLTWPEIAEKLNRTESSVRNKITYMRSLGKLEQSQRMSLEPVDLFNNPLISSFVVEQMRKK